MTLKKVIEPGSYRYLGMTMPDVHPNEIPVGAKELQHLTAVFDPIGYQVGGTAIRNAIVLERNGMRFLYVRPEYHGYRKVALAAFCGGHIGQDFDHVLARSLANKIGMNYVLLTRISRRANRSHGAFERQINPDLGKSGLCYADRRIWDKWLGRPPKLFNRSSTELRGFTSSVPQELGLTLKQKGKWAQAIGFDENYALPKTLKPIKISSTLDI